MQTLLHSLTIELPTKAMRSVSLADQQRNAVNELGTAANALIEQGWQPYGQMIVLPNLLVQQFFVQVEDAVDEEE